MAMAQLFEIGDISIGNQGADTNAILAKMEAERLMEEKKEKLAKEKLYRNLSIAGGVLLVLVLLVLIIKKLKKPKKILSDGSSNSKPISKNNS